MNLLDVNNVSFSYPTSNQKVLDDITFSVKSGEYVAILGNNGSGKSTLARIICNFLTPSSGNIAIPENLITGIVFQSPKNQIVSEIVSRDTEFGPENLGLSSAEVEQRTIESLAVTGLLDKATSKTNELSLGQTQKLALSGILALSPNLLVLDEATAMLDPASRQDILDYLDYSNKHGQTIIHITHDYEEVLRSERVIVLEKGRKIFDEKTSLFLNNKELVNNIFGTPLEVNVRNENKVSEVVFKAESIVFKYEDKCILNNFNLSLTKGSLTALTGISGAGKSTFLELGAGLLIPESGKILCNSRPTLALQDSQSALFEKFVADDVAFGPRNIGKKGKELKDVVRNSMNKVGLPFEEYADRYTFMLSGGEKRKLSIAGILAMESDILFFDEPTAGLDPKSRKKVLEMFKELTKSGKTILFSTHRMDEAAFADRHVSIKNGCISNDSMILHEKNSMSEKKLNEKNFITSAKLLFSLRKSFEFDKSEKKSLLRNIQPCLKYLLFLFIFITGLIINKFPFDFLLVGTAILYSVLSKVSIKKVFFTFLKVVPWLMIYVLLQMVLFPIGENEEILLDMKYFIITERKLILCGRTFLHTFCAFTSIIVFVSSTSEKDLLEGISQLLKPLKFLKIPIRSFIVVMEIIFRFIPLLMEEAESIIKTQIIRGGLGESKNIFSKVKILIPLFAPLIAQTIKRSEVLAEALTARYF